MSNPGKRDWSSEERVQRMIKRYPLSYHEHFWDVLLSLIGSNPREAIADFGCGPGLLLVDLVKKFQAKCAYGFDESENMLKQASHFLSEILPKEQFILQRLNLDVSQISLEPDSIDLAFAGHMFHEIKDPSDLSSQVLRALKPGGRFAVFDFISGNPEGFVKTMVKHGMDEEHARARYPHMCKYSLDDLTNFLSKSGFSNITFEKIDLDSRALVVGVKM
ncbi:MAG: class I SAM-dependent methyltransferase [Candidatus Thorarchaeota archaeon]